MQNPLSRHISEISHNAILKRYPDGFKLTVASKPIFREKGYEKASEELKQAKPKNMNNPVRSDNMKRARQSVYDIARLNQFRWFITWTLDSRLIARYNPAEVSQKLKTFLSNKVQRNDARYLIIPEYHKDKAIHIHGLLSGNFQMLDSGKKTKTGKTVYNMQDWKFGFSTAVELDESTKAVSFYITKYCCKDFTKIFGSTYYAGGHGLIRKPDAILCDLDFDKVNARAYHTDYVSFRYKDFDSDEDVIKFLEEHSPDE